MYLHYHRHIYVKFKFSVQWTYSNLHKDIFNDNDIVLEVSSLMKMTQCCLDTAYVHVETRGLLYFVWGFDSYRMNLRSLLKTLRQHQDAERKYKPFPLIIVYIFQCIMWSIVTRTFIPHPFSLYLNIYMQVGALAIHKWKSYFHPVITYV